MGTATTSSHPVCNTHSLHDALPIYWRTGGAAATERHKNHLVPDWLAAIPTAMLTDEHAIGEPRTHRRRGEGQAQGGAMRSPAVIRTDRRGDLLRILRSHARVHILTPLAVGPDVESTFISEDPTY